MSESIIIRQPSNDKMGSSFMCLLDALSKLNNNNSNEINLDLSNLTFVYPFLILPISALIADLRSRSTIVNIIYGSKCRSYLETIKFETCLTANLCQSFEEQLHNYKVKTYLPVCSIPTKRESSKEREELLTTFEDILISQLGIKGQLRTALGYLLSEAITNIVDHAKVSSGFIMVQNYPNKKFLDVCIVDTGIGIRKSYNPEKYREIKSDSDALELALNGKSTKKQAVTRGYGISTSRKMLVNGLGGKYFLFSGNAFYIFSSEHEMINKLDKQFRWNGTMLALRIPKEIPSDFQYINYLE